MIKETVAKIIITEGVKKGIPFVGKVMNKKKKVAFISDCNKKSNFPGFRKVYVPMKRATLSTETEREDTIKRLKIFRYEELGAKHDSRLTIRSSGLPVTAGFIIGYSLHTRDNIELIYETQEGFYKNISSEIIGFKKEVIDERENCEDAIDLCFYIQAKNQDIGSSVFQNYIQNSDLNPYIVSLVNTQEYSINLNLEKTATSLTKVINEYYGKLEKEYSKKINIHLFYNGIFELALSIGNQLSPTVPVQLYDYGAKETVYRSSFQLHGELFN